MSIKQPDTLLGFALAADAVCSVQPEMKAGVRAEVGGKILDLLAAADMSTADVIDTLSVVLHSALKSADPRLIPLAKYAPYVGQLATTLNVFMQSADPMVYRNRVLPDRLGRLDAALWSCIEHMKENGWTYLDIGLAVARADKLLLENIEAENWPGGKAPRGKM